MFCNQLALCEYNSLNFIIDFYPISHACMQEMKNDDNWNLNRKYLFYHMLYFTLLKVQISLFSYWVEIWCGIDKCININHIFVKTVVLLWVYSVVRDGKANLLLLCLYIKMHRKWNVNLSEYLTKYIASDNTAVWS